MYQDWANVTTNDAKVIILQSPFVGAALRQGRKVSGHSMTLNPLTGELSAFRFDATSGYVTVVPIGNIISSLQGGTRFEVALVDKTRFILCTTCKVNNHAPNTGSRIPSESGVALRATRHPKVAPLQNRRQAKLPHHYTSGDLPHPEGMLSSAKRIPSVATGDWIRIFQPQRNPPIGKDNIFPRSMYIYPRIPPGIGATATAPPKKKPRFTFGKRVDLRKQKDACV